MPLSLNGFDAGPANQVRLVRGPTDKRLVCCQVQANPPLLPHIISLCLELGERIEIRKLELFKKYEKHVPAKVGEYILNIQDPNGDFFKLAQPVVETSESE